MVRARKRFGQNFLTDRGIIGRIVRSIDIGAGDHVLEIGPGSGALTRELRARTDHLKVVEIDRDLAATLRDEIAGLDLVNADIMQVDIESLSEGEPVRVVGNLPYNISTPLLFRLFSHASIIRDMHFMLQLEVVDRMTAAHSTRAYGRLSVMTQLHCQAHKLFEVPSEAFSPRPKVTSAIVRLKPKTLPDNLDMKLMERMLIEAFSARRKTIRNALKRFLAADQLQALGLDPGLRPENLTVDDFIRCCRAAGAAG